MHHIVLYFTIWLHAVFNSNLVLILKEHFYDGENGSGYLAWRLKTVQRRCSSSEREGPSSSELTNGGPTARREFFLTPDVSLSTEQCKEAVSFMKHSSNEAAVRQKMKMTFEHRRQMVLDEDKSSDVLTEFPRFKDIKGLVIDCFTELCP